MRKNLWFAALAGALLAGCSTNDVETSFEQELQAHRQVPVEFGTYLGGSAATRAGAAGEITTSNLKDCSFGVFAYYTEATNYAKGQTSTYPNFMYNQKVTSSDGSTWSYSPIKYWPNEVYTTATDGTPTGSARSKVSFFAYAPFVGDTNNKNTLAKGETTGITSLIANDTSSDPKVGYVVNTDPTKAVDLLWAANANQTKQTTTGKIKFTFAHALARLSLAVQGAFDSTTAGDGTLDNQSTITVKNIKITSSNLNTSGTLNLVDGTWENATATENWTSTISPSDLTVDNTVKDVADSKFMFIPTTSGIISVEIEYDVETKDSALKDEKIVVNNKIKNEISSLNLTAGAWTRLKLVVGMTTVKVEAEVTTWPDSATDSNPVWLPVNKTE